MLFFITVTILDNPIVFDADDITQLNLNLNLLMCVRQFFFLFTESVWWSRSVWERYVISRCFNTFASF